MNKLCDVLQVTRYGMGQGDGELALKLAGIKATMPDIITLQSKADKVINL